MQPVQRQRLTGTEFQQQTRDFLQPEYRTRSVQEVMNGNIPDFMRRENFREIVLRGTIGGRPVEAHVRVCTDFISVGTNNDFIRLSLSALDGQKLADHFGCVLPTEKLVDALYDEARKRGSYLPFRAAPEIADNVTDPQTSKPLGLRWNPNRPSGRWMMSAIFSNVQSRMTEQDVKALRPNGEPIYEGHKKETVYHPHLLTHRLVAFWRPGQTPHKGYLPHEDTYYDYSQAIRLIDPNVTLVFTNRDGTRETVSTTFANVVADRVHSMENSGLFSLLSDYKMDVTQMYRPERFAARTPVRRR